MLIGQFTLPLAFDLAATFRIAVTGAMPAMRKGYDFVGVFFLALVTGIGGGLLRDGVFLQQVPAVLDSHYLLAVVVAAIARLASCMATPVRPPARQARLLPAIHPPTHQLPLTS